MVGRDGSGVGVVCGGRAQKVHAVSTPLPQPSPQRLAVAHTFMCIVRSSLTTKRFLLHLVHAKGFSPWKCRRKKCFLAWYFVANSLPQS